MKMLLQERKEHGTPDRPSLRIGISGPPGVGKSMWTAFIILSDHANRRMGR